MHKLVLLAVLAALFACAPALADEWTVLKLRGGVQQLIDGNWSDLKRGDVVPDDRTVRTLADGHADLQRAEEIITLGASTQIRIHDKTGTRYTTVQQDFGTVEIEAEVENVQHFAVETKFLAAVVKGTHFIVTANDLGASVTVDRGFVAVESMASHRTTTVTIGQTASVAPTSDMILGGDGTLPAIYAPDGVVVRPAGSPAQLLPGSPRPGGATLVTAGGTASDETTTTAMLLGPANGPAAIPKLRGAINGSGGFGTLSLPSGGGASSLKQEPINLMTILVGLLVGIVIGAIALLLRRSVG